MRIRIPFCAPFEIVGHRPGHPVGETTTHSANASTLRNYLLIKLRRRVRPAWANQENLRSAVASENSSEASFVTAAENLDMASLENSAERVCASPRGADHAPEAAHSTDDASAAAQSLSPDLQALAQWVDEGPLIERMQHAEVAMIIARCWLSPNDAEISIHNKEHLTSLPPMPPSVTKLEVWMCSGLLTPPALHEGSRMRNLSFLNCGSLRRAPDVSHCAELKNLCLQDCDEMTAPPDIAACRNLNELNFSGCTRLAALPDLAACP